MQPRVAHNQNTFLFGTPNSYLQSFCSRLWSPEAITCNKIRVWLSFSVWSPPSPFHLIWEMQKLFIRHIEVCRHLQLTPYDPWVYHLVIILDRQDCLTPIITLIALNCPWVHCLIIKFLLEFTILPLLSVCRHAVSLGSKYL